MRNKLALILFVLVLMFAVLPAYSQNDPLPDSSSKVSSTEIKPASIDGNKRKFSLIPYTWATGIDSTITVRGHEADSSITLFGYL
jgi:hypothetical protein